MLMDFPQALVSGGIISGNILPWTVDGQYAETILSGRQVAKDQNNPVHKHSMGGSYTFFQVLSLIGGDLESYDSMGFLNHYFGIPHGQQ